MTTTIYQRLLALLGTEVHKGSPGDPPQSPTLYYSHGRRTTPDDPDAEVISANNDGYELWFGYRDRWLHHMRQEDVRLLTWYLLWEWHAKARWFGLRRPLYYWALSRHLSRHLPQTGTRT